MNLVSFLKTTFLTTLAITAASQSSETPRSLSKFVPANAPLNGAAPSACPPLFLPYAENPLPKSYKLINDAPYNQEYILELSDGSRCVILYVITEKGIEIQGVQNREDLSEPVLDRFIDFAGDLAANDENIIPIFEELLGDKPIPKHWDSWFTHGQKNSNNSFYRYLLEKGTCNALNGHGITPIQRAAREADLITLENCLKTQTDTTVLNPEAYLTDQTLQDCKAPETSLSTLDAIPLEQFTYPFLVVQNQCNTYVQKKNGDQVILKHTLAQKVHDHLSQRYQESIGKDFSPAKNFLEIYLNPGHAFWRISCESCFMSEEPMDESIGFYPSNNNPLDIGELYDETNKGKLISDANNYLKITIPITDEQAQKVFVKMVSIKAEQPTYDMTLRNCLDVAQEVFSQISSNHFLRFFTNEQLNTFPATSQPAIQYAIYEHQYHLPMRMLMKGFWETLVVPELMITTMLYKPFNYLMDKTVGMTFPTYSFSEIYRTIPYCTSTILSYLLLDGTKSILGSGQYIIALSEIYPSVATLSYSLYDMSKSGVFSNKVAKTYFAKSAGKLMGLAGCHLGLMDSKNLSDYQGFIGLGLIGLLFLSEQIANKGFRDPITRAFQDPKQPLYIQS